jgi:hypothetical protein
MICKSRNSSTEGSSEVARRSRLDGDHAGVGGSKDLQLMFSTRCASLL